MCDKMCVYFVLKLLTLLFSTPITIISCDTLCNFCSLLRVSSRSAPFSFFWLLQIRGYYKDIGTIHNTTKIQYIVRTWKRSSIRSCYIQQHTLFKKKSVRRISFWHDGWSKYKIKNIIYHNIRKTCTCIV